MFNSRHRSRVVVAVVFAICFGACGKRERAIDTSAASAPSAVTPESIASAPAGKPPCPATGLWAECSAFDALDRAGLAPRRDSSTGTLRMDPLTRPGTRIVLGGAQLDLFIYPSAAERGRDEARLDKHQFIEATDEPTLRGEATLIRNENLLAILHSRNDHQRERVSDALSAGPPQPRRAAPIPGSTAR